LQSSTNIFTPEEEVEADLYSYGIKVCVYEGVYEEKVHTFECVARADKL